MAATTRESPLERYMLQQCRAHGWLFLKFISPMRGGVPDRILVTPTGTLFVEMKRPGEKPTTRQLAQHRKISSRGGEVHVIDSYAGVDAFIAEIEDRCAGHFAGRATPDEAAS